MKQAVSNLPPFGDGGAHPDSVEYAVYIRDQANACLHKRKVDQEGVELYIKVLQKGMFTKLLKRDGSSFRNWTDFCLTEHPYGLGRSPQDIETIITEARDPQTIALSVVPLNQPEIGNGKAGPGRGHKTVDNVNRLKGGNSAEYRIRKLARDHEDIYERLKAGEFQSVAAAERAAGIQKVKEKSLVDQIIFLLEKASRSERKTIAAWIKDNA